MEQNNIGGTTEKVEPKPEEEVYREKLNKKAPNLDSLKTVYEEKEADRRVLEELRAYDDSLYTAKMAELEARRVSPGKTQLDKVAEDNAQKSIAALEPEVSTSLEPKAIKQVADSVPKNTLNGKLLSSVESMKDITYQLGDKKGKSLDCSAFAVKVLEKGGFNVPKDDLSSQGIWANSKDKNTYKDWTAIPNSELRPGTVIAFDTGDHGFDAGRKYGIDHVGVIVHDEDGRPMIAESAYSKGGVTMTPYQDRMAELEGDLVNVYTGHYGNTEEPSASSEDEIYTPSVGGDSPYEYTWDNYNPAQQGSGFMGAAADAALGIMNAVGMEHEDVSNVLESIKQGATLDDVQTLANSYIADKIGSQSDLIEATPEINTSPEGLVNGMKISEKATVDQPLYQSKNFVLDLNQVKGFDTLPNVTNKYQAGGKNIDQYYKELPAMNGNIVMSVQQNIESNQTAQSAITPASKFNKSKAGEYVMTLNNGQLKVKKTSSISDGDNVFKNKKMLNFEDLDIDINGNIRVKWDDNIGAWIPHTKSGSSYVIGLNDDKSNTTGAVHVEDANQYGRSRGGSFVVFSKDTKQQYMVGGSFKDLYKFYQDLKRKNPNTDYSMFVSDTGTYSNSVFPKNGKLDGDVVRKSNFRNTWGNLSHIVLKQG